MEWFATRDPEGIALAADCEQGTKGTGIKRLRKESRSDKLAAWSTTTVQGPCGQAMRATRSLHRVSIRSLGSGGRINLYSLFVERAMNLIKPDGFVGLLTPSGIYADKTAARFFKSVSTSGRASGLFDFENKKIFFKDIHASFKFCALIFGGVERQFEQDRMRLFHARRGNDRRREPLLSSFTPDGLRPGQPQHWHRALSSALAATPRSPAASMSIIPCWWIAQAVQQCKAYPVRSSGRDCSI